jgi:signal transduction histidine kinase
VRFDDALDAALTKSISEFATWLDGSREKFLGILGHDLRNPLSAIIGAAHLINDSPKSNANEEVRFLTGRIIHSGERMHRMLVDLLDFARMRLGGTMPIERRATDLEKALRNLAEEFSISHPQRPLRVEINGDLRGRWDDQRINQAVANLLGNAANHGTPNTPIILGARSCAQDVSISVHNEGPPIPPERRDQIFEPLVRGSERSHASGDRSSIGLGLYIAKAIVTGHGGRIEVDSSAKKGTTFTIHLPR